MAPRRPGVHTAEPVVFTDLLLDCGKPADAACHSDRNDAILDGEVDQLGTALQFERFHHLILMVLDGPRRNVELGSDILG